MGRRFLWLAGFVALRGAVIVTGTVLFAVAAAMVDSPWRSRSGSDWGVDRLGAELVVGGLAGLLLGCIVAVRLGRRRYDGPARALQTLVALAIPALIAIGVAMEQLP